jgi:hypothetical protein
MPTQATTDPDRELQSSQNDAGVVDRAAITRPTRNAPRAMAEAKLATTSILRTPPLMLSNAAREIFGKSRAFRSLRLHGNLIA